MSEICRLYADGGVISINPSPVGGTWAWVMTDENDERVAVGQGHITPFEAAMPAVTNNLTEMLAAIYGLERLPITFSGTVYSDSQVTLGRIFMGWKWNGIPRWMHERYQNARSRLVDWDVIRFVLLDGHPTKAQLAAGIGKRGHPVSRWNVECDRLCGEAARSFLQHG